MYNKEWLYNYFCNVQYTNYYGPGVDSPSNKNEYQESSWK
jgi:hypothetical protein